MTDILTRPDLDPNRDPWFARHMERAEAGAIFGPQLDIERFRQLCARALQQETFDTHTRMELNHFALWAPESFWHEIARLIAPAPIEQLPPPAAANTVAQVAELHEIIWNDVRRITSGL